MLSHSKRGAGPESIVLLHGFLGSGRNLGALTRAWSALQPHLRFIQCDLLGHGRSPPLDPGADLYTNAEAALELIEHLDLPTPVHVVGHSLGGRVALALLDEAPHLISKVDILDIAPGPTHGLPSSGVARILLDAPDHSPRREDFSAFFLQAGLSRGLTEWLLMNLEPSAAGYEWRIDRAALVEFHHRTGGVDMWPVAERHRAKLGAFIGGASDYLRPESIERFEALGVPLTFFEGAGHFVHVDATEEVAASLARSHEALAAP